MSAMPRQHEGLHYMSLMSSLSKLRETQNYLEIGVQQGIHFSVIHANHAVAVDPGFLINQNIANNKNSVYMHNGTSDSFFRSQYANDAMKGRIDLAFLDGLHVFEFLLRDFFNTEALSATHGLIALHDCLPITAAMAQRNEAEAHKMGADTHFPGAWTGDVWKVVSILKKFRKDLRVLCFSAAPTGLILITNLDPTSTTLRDNYLDIVEEYAKIPNDQAAIEAFYDGIELLAPEDAVRDFDHSLFFRV
ncbi:class I SAM-dependent methyltransferase [Methylorubrum rhodesianum]|uniref:Class I SAM-dependent methyltransferase n=1 Tax=Methylorubrum rhodesianum TaxID=29427 RepID=A0ABU9ZG12_9HYPH